MDPHDRAVSVWYRVAGLVSRERKDLAERNVTALLDYSARRALASWHRRGPSTSIVSTSSWSTISTSNREVGADDVGAAIHHLNPCAAVRTNSWVISG
jgi:hypothetical protein